MVWHQAFKHYWTKNAPVQDPKSADTAIFYSISNAQKGLAGISFGNFLIKRVAAQLSQEFPALKTFATSISNTRLHELAPQSSKGRRI